MGGEFRQATVRPIGRYRAGPQDPSLHASHVAKVVAMRQQTFPQPQQASAVAPMPEPRNGMGVTALVLGLVGLVVGLVPLLGLIGVVIGVVGVTLGAVGIGRAKRRTATNRRMAITGTVLSSPAIVLGLLGFVLVNVAVSDALDTLKGKKATPVAAARSGKAAVSASPEPPASDDGTAARFGRTYRYPDGIEVTVSKPRAFNPSAFVAAQSGDAVRVEITIKNGSKRVFETVAAHATAMVGDTAAETVFDVEKNVEGPPNVKLRPGKSVRFTSGFEGPADAEWQVQFTPGVIGYDDVVYTAKG